MRAAFEATHGRLEDSYEPSEEYICSKMEEIESHEPQASPLSEVTSRKTRRTQGIQTAVDSSGHVRISSFSNSLGPEATTGDRVSLGGFDTCLVFTTSRFLTK